MLQIQFPPLAIRLLLINNFEFKMLSPDTTLQLKSLGIEATHSKDFVSGLRLMQLVIQVFYQGENRELSSKIRMGDQNKTGNNVLNINIILNHLKRDASIIIDEKIREMTAFKLIQQENQMKELIEWILSKNEKVQKQILMKEDMSPPRQQQNEFQNLYFISAFQNKQPQHDDSLEEVNPQERVVRKGSVKVLKPKLSSDSKLSREDSHKRSFQGNESNMKSEVKEPLREKFIVSNNSLTQCDDRDDLNCRKTIPKMYEKPPLYRSRQKQTKSNEKPDQKRTPPQNITSRPTDRQSLLKNIENINQKIAQEEKSLQLNAAVQIKPAKSRKSQRKIFKIEIPEVDEKKKKILLQWLITINLLGSNAAKFLENLQTICKDGVIFLEIVNYYRGRGKQMCYFKEPKKSAEVHSNYQKLFSALNELPQFKSQLLYQYQYFVPQAQPNAFWNMLLAIHFSFNKRVQNRQPSITRFQNTINKKIQRQHSKKKSLNEQISYEQIRYSSSSVSKQKNSCSSAELPRKETPQPKSRQESVQSQKSSIKINGPYGLVQNEQPNEEIYRTQRGYKQMYLCKFKNIETPQKNRSFHNSSLSKSRIKTSVGSSKKKQFKPMIPSITLQMQMKVLKFLSSYQIDEELHQLFKDPYRNGTLLCNIVLRILGVECFASRKPKNIDDCRNNYLLSIETIKSHRRDFNVNYQYFVEQLIKGQKSLLYGIIWQLIRDTERQTNKYIANYQPLVPGSKQTSEQNAISWIRSIERSYPEIGEYKIRSESMLYNSIVCTDFLFHYSWFITGKKAVTPTYQRPVNDIQKESNLKKVLGYLVQNKIIRSDYLWKSRSLVKREQTLIKDLVLDLINHFNNLYKKEQSKSVNFVKYLKRQDSEGKEKPQQKLQTTMANQTISNNNIAPSMEAKMEVPWMRKLGFNGNLQLNNGVVLCRLMVKLNMKSIDGINQHPQSRPECLGNIRRAIKDIPKFRWDEYDIYQSDQMKALEIYAFIKDKYKHAYAMKGI